MRRSRRFRVAYQILSVTGPQVWDKAVLCQGTLIRQLNASRVANLHLKVKIGLVLSQLGCLGNQLELKQGGEKNY